MPRNARLLTSHGLTQRDTSWKGCHCPLLRFSGEPNQAKLGSRHTVRSTVLLQCCAGRRPWPWTWPCTSTSTVPRCQHVHTSVRGCTCALRGQPQLSNDACVHRPGHVFLPAAVDRSRHPESNMASHGIVRDALVGAGSNPMEKPIGNGMAMTPSGKTVTRATGHSARAGAAPARPHEASLAGHLCLALQLAEIEGHCQEHQRDIGLQKIKTACLLEHPITHCER